MTKKDFILVAAAIDRARRCISFTEGNAVKKTAKMDAIRLVVNGLSGEFYGVNRRFDRDRFIKACGF